MSDSVVDIIRKEIEFQRSTIQKQLVSGIKEKQEWLINQGMDRSGLAAGMIHETWASVVDPYIDNLIGFVVKLPDELNRDYSTEELNEIEDLLQENYSGLLAMKSTLYSPQVDSPVRDLNPAAKNLKITIGIDKIRLKIKLKKKTLSDEFIIKTFDQQKEENEKNKCRFLITVLISIVAIGISIASLIITG